MARLGINPVDLRMDSVGVPLLKVWWIPQIPMKGFEVYVTTLVQAKTLLKSLAQYDLFQLDNNIKPDFSNVGGLQVFKGGDWEDWENEEGDGIDVLTMAQCVELDRVAATDMKDSGVTA